MRIFALFLSILAISFALPAGDLLSPYEDACFSPVNKIDELQLANLRKIGIRPAKICSDAIFMRRAYLDIIGTLPTFNETTEFLSDTSKDKRAKLIDRLLERDEFAFYWALKWGDVLRIKSEFTINLWPNAVQAYSHWVWDSVRKNKPYDKFATELITSSGSSFRDPPVNFYRSTPDKTPAGIAKIAALAFLGSRFQDWGGYEQKEFQKLFSRISYKKTSEWKEEIVFLNPEPASFTVNMPDGTLLSIEPGADPREAFAGWLNGPAKKWFAQAAVNRIWFWFFGRGIVHEADNFVLSRNGVFMDQILPGLIGTVSSTNYGNPPVNPELLDWLAEEFIRSGYDFKAMVKLIANSATYQQSCIPAGDITAAEKYFAVYKSRRLDAEVLADALSYLAGIPPKYMSVIPEPFTYVPGEFSTISLNDGSITSSFLENFGRSARDTGYLSERNNEVSYSQRLFLLNSSEVQNKVCNTPLLKDILKESRGDAEKVIDDIYLLILSRYPSKAETDLILENYKGFLEEPKQEPVQKKQGKKGDVRERGKFKNVNLACRQLIWTLVNSKEFIFNH